MSRILFLVSSMEGGGAERVAAWLCNHWVVQGHEVILMPTFSGRGECVYPLDDRVQLDYLADHVKTKRRSLFNRLQRFQALRRFLLGSQPDVILSFLPHVNVAAILVAQGLGVPVIIAERTYPPARSIGNLLGILRRITYPRATAVAVQTGKSLAWLSDNCPRAIGKVIPNPAVYPLPTSIPVLCPTSFIGEGRRVVLAVGRLNKEKGFERLIAAFAMLADSFRGWDLVILGEGPERSELSSKLHGLGLSQRVFLPGRAGNPGDWYARADLFVMSSYFEGFPNTLVEAMAHGVPAVSFDCDTGPSDIIRVGVDGYLVSLDEGVAGLVNAMRGLMEDDHKRKVMSEEAALVRQRFDEKRILREWDALLGLC